MQFFTLFVLYVFGNVCAGYPEASKSENDIGSSYGYAGSFSGGGPGNIPIPNFPHFDFDNFLNGYFESLKRTHEQFIQHGGGAYSFSYASSSPNSKAFAKSNIIFDSPSSRHSLQQDAQTAKVHATSGGVPSFGTRGGFGGGYSGSYDGGAVASGSIGPGGIHQTAAVYPENTNTPNVNVRFGGGGGSPGDGYHSVFTSSQSHTTNVDGRPQTFQEAETTVNDNGKVTTYRAHNP